MSKVEYSSKLIHKISNYDGKQGELIKLTLKNPVSKEKINDWNYFRKSDNHSYVHDFQENYGETCKNNLIISKQKNLKLENICNAFILFDGMNLNISPIYDSQKIIEDSKKILSSGNIKYNIPKSVLKRINLSEKNLFELRKQIESSYDFSLSEITPFNRGRAKNGIFYIKNQNNDKFIFKYLGKKQEKFENLLSILSVFPKYFPKTYLTKDKKHVIKINDEIYGLEKFIDNKFAKQRNLNYFKSIGPFIGKLHNDLKNTFETNERNFDFFKDSNNFLNESGIISSYLDLCFDSKNPKFFLSEFENLFDINFLKIVNKLPKNIIHKDLNHSNILWPIKDTPKIIDLETIGKATRITEFINPLLFGGNMTKPNYILGGIETIIQGYEKTSKIPLSDEEKITLPKLIKYSLFTNYVVRKIKRNGDEETHFKNLQSNLKKLERDSKNDSKNTV